MEKEDKKVLNGYGRKWKQAWRLVNAAIESVEDFEVMNIA